MTDPLGQAMADYHHGRRGTKLWIYNTYGPREEMPVAAYFRKPAEMPQLEQLALSLCTGKILDIGAGAGSQALELQQLGKSVTALEISAVACDVMKQRGVEDIVCQDIFTFSHGCYDTLLLMMNGIGLAGTLNGLRAFLQQARKLLEPDGQLLFDSSDVAYVYQHQLPDPTRYYGEIDYYYQYKKMKSDWFSWLYIDFDTLVSIATSEGWQTEWLSEDENGQYLVRMTRAQGA